nr:IclR family transcriptional regulator [Antricoccus suffuscus]
MGRVISVLDCFSVREPVVSAARVRELTALPVTTANRLLRNLVAHGLVQRDGENFKLGLRILGWSESAKAASSLLAIAGPVIERLKDKSGETITVGVRIGSKRTVIADCQSDKSLIYRPHIGQVLPLHAGSGGKTLLAFDRADLEVVELVKLTAATITDRKAFIAELDRIRERGWAFAVQEREEGLNSASAPVFDARGDLLAVVTIGGPSFRMPKQKAQVFGAMVRESADELSELLGRSRAAAP